MSPTLRLLVSGRLPRLLAIGTLVVGFAVAEALCAVAVGDLIDAALAGRPSQRPAVVLVGLVGVTVAMWSSSRLLLIHQLHRGAVGLRTTLLEHVLAQPLERSAARSVGETTDRISGDVDRIVQGLSEPGRALLAAVTGAAAALVAVAVVGPWALWTMVPVLVVLALAGRHGIAGLARAGRAEQNAWASGAGTVEEALNARDDLRQAQGRGLLLRRWSEHSALVHAAVRRVGLQHVRLNVLIGTLMVAQNLGIVLMAVGPALSGRLEAGTVYSLLGLAMLCIGHLDNVLRQLGQLTEMVAAATRLDALLAEPVEPEVTAAAAAPAGHGPGALRLHRVSFAYPDGPEVLHDVSLEVAPGRTLALVGRTGSGKSTLTRLLNRTVATPVGRVTLDGTDVCAVPLPELRTRIGVVPQRVEMFPGTLRDNVALFDPAVDDAAIARAFSRLGMADWYAGLPDGAGTLLGDGGVEPSAGERQLVALARLLVRDPEVVVLDEATSRLDPVTQERVTRATDRLLTGRTAVVVAHRLATVSAADDVAVLEDGRLVEHGPRTALLADPGSRYHRMVAEAGTRPGGDGAAGDGVPAELGGGGGEDPVPPDASGGPATSPAAPDADPVSPGAVRRMLALVATLAWRLPPRGPANLVMWWLVQLPLAAAAWVWSGLLPALAPGGEPWPWIRLYLVASVAARLGEVCCVLWFFPWMASMQLRMRGRVLAESLLPGRRTGRLPVGPGQATARIWDLGRVFWYSDHLLDLGASVVFLAATAVLSGSLAATAAAASVLLLPVLTTVLVHRRLARASVRETVLRGEWFDTVARACSAVTTVKAYAGERHVLARIRGNTEARQSASRALAMWRSVTYDTAYVAAHPFGYLMVAVVALAGAGPAAVAAAAALRLAMENLGMGAWMVTTMLVEGDQVAQMVSRAEDLLPEDDTGLMRVPEGLSFGPRPLGPVPTARAGHRPLHRLALEGVTVVHPDGTRSLDGVRLEVSAGEFVVVTGVVASGKSTLLRVLAGLQPPTEGTLRWNGEVVPEPEELLRPPNCSYLAQEPRLVSGTVAENVALDHDVDVAAALAAGELHGELPDGEGTLIGHRGLKLSGGQTQRLATARALAPGSDLLVLDDLSSALDAATERRVWTGLRQRGATVVAVSHSPVALALADRVVTLDAGRVVSDVPGAAVPDAVPDAAVTDAVADGVVADAVAAPDGVGTLDITGSGAVTGR